MEVFGKSSMVTNVIYLSSILGQDGPCVHKCDWRCANEHVCGNMYRCRLTGLTHICDKNCNQRILYDNHTSLCRVTKHIFPLTPLEQQAVRGVRRKLETTTDTCPAAETCALKRTRRDVVHYQPSPFQTPIIADGMDMRYFLLRLITWEIGVQCQQMDDFLLSVMEIQEGLQVTYGVMPHPDYDQCIYDAHVCNSLYTLRHADVGESCGCDDL